MREIPVLFNGAMVRAIQEDRKTVMLEVTDWRRQARIVLTRRDLTAIIAGLTAIRDAMPEGE